MAASIFLALSALLWFVYGVYCFAAPASLAEAAGVVSQSATGSTELRAMYGGLQAAIGLLAGGGALRISLQRPALVALGFLAAGLFASRLAGLAIDGGFTSYTGMALAFESVSAATAFALLGRAR
jgi:hypothetical protein